MDFVFRLKIKVYVQKLKIWQIIGHPKSEDANNNITTYLTIGEYFKIRLNY